MSRGLPTPKPGGFTESVSVTTTAQSGPVSRPSMPVDDTRWWRLIRAPSVESFHRWRKRVRYLERQMEILTPLWPEVMIGMAITLDRISELLGQDHDLAELLQALADRPDLCPNPLERALMTALAEQRRSDLQTAARILGRRIYAEAPSAFAGRLGAYWESMELSRTTHLVSLAV